MLPDRFCSNLDYVIGAKKLEPGKINRTTRENIYPGGKGNNVSVVLSNLGHKSKALGFVSGFTGEALEKMLDDFYIDSGKSVIQLDKIGITAKIVQHLLQCLSGKS